MVEEADESVDTMWLEEDSDAPQDEDFIEEDGGFDANQLPSRYLDDPHIYSPSFNVLIASLYSRVSSFLLPALFSPLQGHCTIFCQPRGRRRCLCYRTRCSLLSRSLSSLSQKAGWSERFANHKLRLAGQLQARTCNIPGIRVDRAGRGGGWL